MKWLKCQSGSQLVVKRKRDNTMVKRKRRKRQIMIYKTLHRKFKIEQDEPQ